MALQTWKSETIGKGTLDEPSKTNRYYYYLDVTELSATEAENESEISVSFIGYGGSYFSNYSRAFSGFSSGITGGFEIYQIDTTNNTETKIYELTQTVTSCARTPNLTTWCSGKYKIKHDSNGELNLKFKVKVTDKFTKYDTDGNGNSCGYLPAAFSQFLTNKFTGTKIYLDHNITVNKDINVESVNWSNDNATVVKAGSQVDFVATYNFGYGSGKNIITYTGNSSSFTGNTYSLIMPNSDVSITFNSTKLEYPVILDSNGGTFKLSAGSFATGWTKESDTIARKSLLYQSKIGTLPSKDFITRSGYIFKGWYTSTTGNTSISTDTIFNPTTDDGITYYAQWEPEIPRYDYSRPNSSTYIEVTGTSSGNYIENTKININITSKLPRIIIDTITINGKSIIINNSSWNMEFTLTENTTITVTTKELSYKIYYNGNGDNVSNIPDTGTKIYNINYLISGDRPLRDGYSFQGWSTTPTGSVEYYPLSTYSQNKDLTLYAVWVQGSWSDIITWVYDGKTNSWKCC